MARNKSKKDNLLNIRTEWSGEEWSSKMKLWQRYRVEYNFKTDPFMVMTKYNTPGTLDQPWNMACVMPGKPSLGMLISDELFTDLWNIVCRYNAKVIVRQDLSFSIVGGNIPGKVMLDIRIMLDEIKTRGYIGKLPVVNGKYVEFLP